MDARRPGPSSGREIGELREMMREVMRRQQRRGAQAEAAGAPGVAAASDDDESPTRSHWRTHFHSEHFQGSTARRGRGWG